ncbi:MAG: hypothetical protein AVDCRST_MAG89-5431, partial [uncultured Gemmatimonadetes bacterium]
DRKPDRRPRPPLLLRLSSGGPRAAGSAAGGRFHLHQSVGRPHRPREVLLALLSARGLVPVPRADDHLRARRRGVRALRDGGKARRHLPQRRVLPRPERPHPLHRGVLRLRPRRRRDEGRRVV